MVAKRHISDLFEAEGIRNVGLEEVERDDGVWLITIGFSRPWDSESHNLFGMAPDPPQAHVQGCANRRYRRGDHIRHEPRGRHPKRGYAMISAVPVATYRVETFQEGDWWLVEVVGLDVKHTQARTLEDVREMARDLVALVPEIDEADVGPIEATENDWR